MGPNILYRNVHTGPRQGKEPGSIVSYFAGPVPCACLVPGQCELECGYFAYNLTGWLGNAISWCS